MKRTLLTVFILTIALATVASNRGTAASISTMFGAQSTDLLTLQKGSVDELREEFHQTYPLSASGRVNVENLNGAVRIAVWDQNQVKVDAVKRAYRSDRLDEAKIEVNATADSIRIKTEYPDRDQTFTDDEGRRNNPATVEYSLTIPRRARIESVEVINGSLDIDGAEGDVKASSINGYVKARALMGEVRLSTVNGGLEATFTRLDEGKAVTLSSVNGNLILVIPSDAHAQVRAGTVHGGISNDFGLPVIHGDYVGHELYGQIGSGGPRIKLGNVNGRIAIKHAADGRTVSSSTNLMTEKEKGRSDRGMAEAREVNEQIREATREATRVQIDAQRVARDVQVQAQREIERAIRESQREVERAQLEIQREVQRQLREQTREQIRTRINSAVKASDRDWGRFIDRESKSFPVSGTPTVKVSTYDGAVTIRAWDKPEVSYTALKRANHEQALKNISIEASQQGSSISIVASSINKSTDDDGSTALEIFVPRNANLDLSSDDGRLSVQGVSGELVARTSDGSIEVEGGQGRLKANTKDGRIRITSYQGEVDVQTGDGPIMLEGTFTGVQARTGDGSIVLGVPADSNFVIETNAESVSNQGLSISEEPAPSTRVKRWRVGRGGAVFTLNTGDGNVILRLR